MRNTTYPLPLIAILFAVAGCRPAPSPAALPQAHAADANQQALRQSRDILTRRSNALRAKRDHRKLAP